MPFRQLALFLVAGTVLFTAGCGDRPSQSTAGTDGIYKEGGFGSPFYAEVTHAHKEGQKPRIYLFGKIAHFEAFLEKKEVPENAHKKYIGKGVNKATIVVQDLTGSELKDNPRYTDKLVEKYLARHAAELAAAPVAAAAAAAPVAAAPFYAEVAHAHKEGQKPRIFLFGKPEHHEAFLKTKEVPENAHKKYIGKGVNKATLVVQDLTGEALKADPGYTDRLVQMYLTRHAAELSAQ